MIAARLSSLALCVGLAGLTLAQSPRGRAPAQGAGDGGKQSFYSDRVDAATHRALQGVWRVEQVDWEGKLWGGRDVAGFALIDEGHLALEIHVRVLLNDAEGMLMQTGIYRYQFSPTGELEAIALIGSDNTSVPLAVTATPPGQISRLRVRLAEDVLTLERPGSRMVLRRTVQPRPPFYEAPPKAGPAEAGPGREDAGGEDAGD